MATEYGDKCWNLVQCMCVFSGDCGAVAEHFICHVDEENCWDEAYVSANEAAVKTACAASDDPIAGECSFSFTVTDECDTNGYISRIWTASWPGTLTKPDYCTGGSDQIPCQTARLVFWGTIGIILTIFLIIVVYVILGRKGKKKSSKKRKKKK